MTAFLTPDFVSARVTEIEQKAGAPVSKPNETVKVLGKQLGFSEELTDEILAHFIMGGTLTAGGVLNAVTSVAQTIADPDVAADVQSKGLQALDLAFAAAVKS